MRESNYIVITKLIILMVKILNKLSGIRLNDVIGELEVVGCVGNDDKEEEEREAVKDELAITSPSCCCAGFNGDGDGLFSLLMLLLPFTWSLLFWFTFCVSSMLASVSYKS